MDWRADSEGERKTIERRVTSQSLWRRGKQLGERMVRESKMAIRRMWTYVILTQQIAHTCGFFGEVRECFLAVRITKQ